MEAVLIIVLIVAGFFLVSKARNIGQKSIWGPVTDKINEKTLKEIDAFKKDMAAEKESKEGTSESQQSDGSEEKIIAEVAEMIYNYCEEVYHSKPTFKITRKTNFKRNLNFDGIDMAEIFLLLEKRFNVKFPSGSPLMARNADDTDYTVGSLLAEYGLIPKSGDGQPEKEQGRYYFYYRTDRCSFKLPEGVETKCLRVEKDGLKHTLMSETGMMIIIEIRPGMPDFGNYPVPTWNTTVAGYPCLVAKPGIIRQYYIDCKAFVVQVDMTPVPDEVFLNSFKMD